MQVRIRHENDCEALPLGDVPFANDSINEAIRLISSWGIAVDGDTENGGTSGQFVYEDGAAYFEILIHAVED